MVCVLRAQPCSCACQMSVVRLQVAMLRCWEACDTTNYPLMHATPKITDHPQPIAPGFCVQTDLRRAMASQAAQRAKQEGGHLMTAAVSRALGCCRVGCRAMMHVWWHCEWF